MALDVCNDAIKNAIGRELTDREKGAVARKAQELGKKIAALKNDPLAMENVLGNFADDIKAQGVINRRNAALNYRAIAAKEAYRKSVDFVAKRPDQAVTGMFRGSLYDYEGARNGLTSLVDHESYHRTSDFIAELENQKLAEYAFSGSDDHNIGMAVHGLRNDVDEGTLASKFGRNALSVAKAMEKHGEALRIALNRAGAWISRDADYVAKQTHDSYKIARAGGAQYGSEQAFQNWMNDIGPKLDWRKSFDGDLMTASQADKITRLRSLYHQFGSNYHFNFNSEPSAFSTGFANLGKRYSHQRELVFNKPEDYLDYNKNYGKGSSIAETYWHVLANGGRDLAIMREWGPNAKQNMTEFFDRWQKDLAKEQRVGDAAKMRASVDRHMKEDWPVISDEVGQPGNEYAARWISAARQTMMAARLGMSIFAAIGDLPLRASELRYAGNRTAGTFFHGLLSSTMDQITGAGLSKTDRMNLAAEAGIRLESAHLPMGINTMDQLGMGRLARFNQQVMKYAGHSFWSNRIRTNSLAADGFRHWTMRDKEFGALPEGTRAVMQQFGINQKGWDVMRKMTPRDLTNQQKVFTPTALAEMPLDKFKSLVADKEPSDTQLMRARDTLVASYRNMLGEMADRVTSSPSRTIRAATNWGNKAPGTVIGELSRGANMLKGFSYNLMRNHLGRELLGYEANPDEVGWGRAMHKLMTGQNRQGAAGLGMLIGASVGYGYISNTLSDLANGKTPENPTGEHWGDAMMRAFARQSLGLYSDFVLGNAGGNRKQSFWDKVGALAGPELETIADIGDWGHQALTTGIKAASGEDATNDFYKLAQSGFSTVYHNLPGNNLFWTKYAMDYWVLHNISEQLNPGYTQRLEQKAAKERGQTYLFGAGPAGGTQ